MTKRRIDRIAIFACSFLTLIFLALGASHWRTAMEVEASWLDKKEELAAVEERILQIEASINRYEREKEDFQKYLFKEQDIPAFLDGISRFAQTALVTVRDMKTRKFRKVEVPNAITESQSALVRKRSAKRRSKQAVSSVPSMLTLAAMPIRIKVEGTYAALVEFLGHLEGFEQLLSISNVELATGKKYPYLNCAFTLKIYSFKTLEELQ